MNILAENILLGFFQKEEKAQIYQFMAKKLQECDLANDEELQVASTLIQTAFSQILLAQIYTHLVQEELEMQKDLIQASLRLILSQQPPISPLTSNCELVTNLMNYINRIINLNAHALNLQDPALFFREWFAKSEVLVSQDSRRLAVLAVYQILPLMTSDQIMAYFTQIGKLSFASIRQFLVQKLEGNDARFYSPTKLQQQGKKEKMKQLEGKSLRIQDLKANDPYIRVDLVDHFTENLRKTQQVLNLASLADFKQAIQDPVIQEIFSEILQVLGQN